MRIARAVVASLAVMGALVLAAPAAGADPAAPGNYDSRVLGIVPVDDDAPYCEAPTPDPQDTAATDAVPMSAKVVGGDGFLDLQVDSGHTLDLPGYNQTLLVDDPWLRIAADGTVERNESSTATYLNAQRYGADVPEGIDKDSAVDNPRWKRLSGSGGYIWHDHRIHWMNKKQPPEVVPGTKRAIISNRDDGTWCVPVTLDGERYEIIGEVLMYDAPSPLPPWLLAGGLAVALGVAGFLLGEPATRLGAGALVVVGAPALWAGVSQLAAVPSAAGGNPVWVALPIATILLGAVGLALRSAAGRAIAVLAGAATLAVWGAIRIPALDKALPLGNLNPTLTRFIIGAALGTAVGAAAAAIASGGLALRLPDLDDDEDDGDSGDGAGDSGEPAPATG